MIKSILITGCSTGIGLHTAMTLNKLGYTVFATARQLKDVEKLKELGLDARQLDINNFQQQQQVLDEILGLTDGTLDALFNNAAYGQPGAIEDLSTEILREQFETNVFAWHELTIRCLKIMRKQGYGRIIQNSSVLGFVTMPFRGAYNASKFAIEGLTDTLRLELAGTNIHISLIEPGPIESNFRKTALQKFNDNIDVQNSVFAEAYQRQIDRLSSDVGNKFTLAPDAVTLKVIHALSSTKPKARYRVTLPTHIFAMLKRILSTRLLDKMLIKG
ncbi:SDR family NAD(P)-dependent oxidoreductase [Pleionea litopenaei]|uniref:SDR family NAD(P)-dependent oxidoreductase n=1 Tax=Pleionea litopenaei TaxID=3070815 RepID=A0AA51RR81_9GAMM|nr:SDR family NAD(P)-dependent oxidoreductase [Pleionea sp. HL-JVS1]WMS86060.1 SDR family NAD(P)-dependent oxidoreductase [Pleionea sp. HL-JVS1]